MVLKRCKHFELGGDKKCVPRLLTGAQRDRELITSLHSPRAPSGPRVPPSSSKPLSPPGYWIDDDWTQRLRFRGMTLGGGNQCGRQRENPGAPKALGCPAGGSLVVVRFVRGQGSACLAPAPLSLVPQCGHSQQRQACRCPRDMSLAQTSAGATCDEPLRVHRRVLPSP